MHPIARTAAVEIDLVVTHRRTDSRGFREMRGVAAAELQRHRMFLGIESQQPLAVAAQDGARGHHLRI